MPTIRWKQLGKNAPYVDWMLTFYSTFVFGLPVYKAIKTFPHDNTVTLISDDPDILEGINYVLENDMLRHCVLIFCGVAAAALVWLPVVELLSTVQFYRTTKIREMWEPIDTLDWYERRRTICCSNTLIELMINCMSGKYINLVATMLVRVVVILVINKYIRHISRLMARAARRR